MTTTLGHVPQLSQGFGAKYQFSGQFIAGNWAAGSDGSVLSVASPWTGREIARIDRANSADVDRAYEAARLAQRGWGAFMPAERSETLRRAAYVMESRHDEIVRWLIDEAGSVRSKAEIEWQAVHAVLLEASTLPSRLEGRILAGDYPGKVSYIHRRPLGVVGVISPWNWPLHLSMRSVAPALALGNSVVVKPAEATPITGGLLIGKIFEEAGLPVGVLNVLVGKSSEIGDQFVQHPASRLISFTGSTSVGRNVGKLAMSSSTLKKTMLELGGNAPLIVTEDVDLDFAAHLALVGKFLHQGQMCIAINRIIVEDSIHDAFVERFVDLARALTWGVSDNPTTAIGPIINQHQFDGILAMIEAAKAAGARHLLGEAPRGLIIPPQVFDNVTPSMALGRNEIFGPIAAIMRATDDDDAVRIANDTEYGLTSGVVCRDLGRALDIASRIDAGMTHINDIPAIDMPSMPFGGEKNSGIGRFGSHDMIEEFTAEHWVSVQRGQSQYPF